MANETNHVDCTDNDGIVTGSPNHIHDFIIVWNIFKRCSMCNRRKSWPWITMVKCRVCKIVVHRRCLRPRSRRDHQTSSARDETGHSDDSAVATASSEPTVFAPSVPSQRPEPPSIVPPPPPHTVSNRGEPLASTASHRMIPLAERSSWGDDDTIALPPGVDVTRSSYLREGVWTTVTRFSDRRDGQAYCMVVRSRFEGHFVRSFTHFLRNDELLFSYQSFY